jgi:xanthine dehydrogenase accessory factor
MIYEKLIHFKKKGIPLILVTAIEKEGEGPVEVGKKMIVTKDNESFGTVGGGALEYNARECCKDLIRKKKNLKKTYLLNEGKILEEAETLNMACGGKVTLFFEYIGPKEAIYIFGAGHVGQALTNILKTMNFHVTVIDPRQEVIDQFKGGDHVICMSFTEYIKEFSLEENSFVVVCTPSHKHDYNVINQVLEQQLKVKYIGMLCSAQKLDDYLQKTYARFGRKIDLHHFYSPIGLDLGGGSPEEIAISITSEILVVSHGKKGHIHMRETSNYDHNHYWKD